MSEQLGSFLPAEEDQIERYQSPREQKIPSLSSAEKEELSRLEKISKQREFDINVFAPALDNIETLLLSEEAQQLLWKEVNPKDVEQEKNNIVKNVKTALARELDIVENEIMEISQKQALIKKLESLCAKFENATFDNFLGSDDLLLLKQIFNSRFAHLFKEQTRQDELGVRSFANYKEQHRAN